MARKIVLIDLDGTLTRSDEGIISSVKYAYRDNNIPVPDDKTLNSFIGPAIMDSMRRTGVSEEKLPDMVKSYRYAYRNPIFDDPKHPGEKLPGMYLNEVYGGIFEALDEMHAKGYYLAVCTAKPEPQALPICEHFDLMEHMDALYGASNDASRINKDQVVAYACEKLNYKPGEDLALMVGDRWTDVDGARDGAHLDCVGARWGYADPGELEEHGCYAFAQTPRDLPAVVDEYFADKFNK